MTTISRIPASHAAIVRRARERMGLTQSAFAHTLGVTQGAITQIERGKVRLTPRMARRIDEVLATFDAERGAMSRCTMTADLSASLPMYAMHLPTCSTCLQHAFRGRIIDREGAVSR